MSELFVNSQVLRRASTLLAALTAGACLGGCPIVNQNHCAYMLENGMDSPCPADQACNRCTAENNGCVPLAQLSEVADACLLGLSSGSTTTPGSSSTTPTEPTTSTTNTETTIGETTMTTEPSTVTDSSTTMMVGTETDTSTTDPSTGSTTSEPLCDPAEGLLDGDCVDPNPYCVDVGMCGPCTALDDIMKSCADAEPGKPVCHVESGRCVECTQENTDACPVDKPGCDEATGSCSKCTEHSQCPDSACDLQTGMCFPTDANSIIWVENTNAECTNGDGTELKPFCTLLTASAALTPGKPTTIMVRPGSTATMPNLNLDLEGYVLAIVRAPNQNIPTLDGKNNTQPMIEVSPGSRVYLSQLRILNTNGGAIVSCAGLGKPTSLYIDDTQIVGNGTLPAKAIDASNCAVQVRRSRIYKNRAGVQIAGGSLIFENSHVTENGTAGSAFGAFNFLSGANATITYSSIALHPTTSTTSTFSCSNAGAITVRNSAVVGPMPLTNCTLIDEAGLVVEEDTKVLADQTAAAWFNGPSEGVLRAESVGGEGPLKGKAIWKMGDPRYDYDREPRPTMGPSWAGADEPQ